jgi:hypothetical protein
MRRNRRTGRRAAKKRFINDECISLSHQPDGRRLAALRGRHKLHTSIHIEGAEDMQQQSDLTADEQKLDSIWNEHLHAELSAHTL